MSKYEFRKIENDGMSGGWPFCDHRRGKNWLCIATGKNAANMMRERCKLDYETQEYDVSNVQEGHALELGCEYVSSGGRNDHDRRFYSVVAILEHDRDRYLVLDEHDTLAQAMRARGVVLDDAGRVEALADLIAELHKPADAE